MFQLTDEQKDNLKSTIFILHTRETCAVSDADNENIC